MLPHAFPPNEWLAMIIIGVSGPYASGKGEVLSLLSARGFVCLSLSDVIREEMAQRGRPQTRDEMIRTGNALREKEGPGALASRVVTELRQDRNYAIDSIRHPAEVSVLRGAGLRFVLIWVEAPEDLRFQRLRKRARPGDPTSLERFRELETSECLAGSDVAQDLEGVRRLADVTISNDGGLGELEQKVQAVLESGLYFQRPGWDEYFLNIADVVASRSNCLKRKVAAVITVDRRIISTGYNGTPRGVRNCNEGGCPRCRRFAPGGTALDECLCSHAEENAITQAAYHGVAVRSGILYTTYSPCLICTKMIINSGIGEVVFGEHYTLGEVAQALLREAGVRLRSVQRG